ncbi:MAG: two-component regulator propeller domain-containing protein [Terracidiphilus sp.]
MIRARSTIAAGEWCRFDGIAVYVWLLALAASGAASLTAARLNAESLKISEYQKQDWQVEDGLPQSNIRMITQTPDGMLLIATSAGMVSFDGIHFKPVKVDARDTIANEAVNALMVARNGDLWIGTDGRGVVIQRKSGGTVNLSQKEGFPTDRIRMFYEAGDGTIWVATQNGIERIRDDKIELLRDCGMISGDITTPFAEDGHGGMFFVTSHGLFLWRNNAARHFPLHQPMTGPAVAAYRDPQQRLWVGMMHGVIQLVERADGWHELPNMKVSGPVTMLVGDADGNLWVGTRHHGINRIAPDGQVSSWTSADGLPNDAIRSMYIDDEQNIWIGMMNGGMERWRKAPLIPYGRPEGLPSEYAANVLSARDGDLWMGTWGKGLFRLRNGKLENIPLPGTPATMPIRALAQDRRGVIWVGTWFNGIYSFDGKELRHYLLGTESPGNAVSSIVGDGRGTLWVGTYTGLMRFPGGTPALGGREMLLAGQLITCMSPDSSGSLLVGTSNGLYRIDGERVQTVSGLSHLYVLSIAEDGAGNVWAGTKAGGLDLIQGVRARHIRTQDGQTEYPVSSLIDDGHGFVWMGTTRGLLRIPSKQLNEVAHREEVALNIRLLGKCDGARSIDFGGPSQPAATLAKDGSSWFATARGFVHTATTSPQTESPPLTARIESVTIDGTDLNLMGDLNLPPGLNELAIHFTAKQLADPNHLEFRYKLDGYDRDWSVTSGRAVHYKRLPPGRYRFLVKARDAGTVWPSQAAELAVRQRPFFYQTIWFYAILAAAFCLLAIQFLRWRITRMKGALGLILEERNRIAREWHDTLMAGFAAISWQLESTVRLLRENNNGDENPATNSCELARSMVSHCQAEARRIIWDLRDGDEPADTLSLALERTLASMRTTRNVETHLEVVGNEVPLAPGSVHQLVCIGQEAVTNALRHADPNRIDILLHYQLGALMLSVKDDGCGFRLETTSEALKGHFGIPVMEERARKLGGTLKVETAMGRGTEIVVSVPFQTSVLAAGAHA